MSALHQAIKLLVQAGNFRQAADREKEVSPATDHLTLRSRVWVELEDVADIVQIAGIYAQDGLDIAKARDSFVRAGDWYKQEDANAWVLKSIPPSSSSLFRFNASYQFAQACEQDPCAEKFGSGPQINATTKQQYIPPN